MLSRFEMEAFITANGLLRPFMVGMLLAPMALQLVEVLAPAGAAWHWAAKPGGLCGAQR